VALALLLVLIYNVIITPLTNSKLVMAAVKAVAVPELTANKVGSIRY